MRGRQEGLRDSVKGTGALREKLEDAILLVLRGRIGPGVKECRQLLEARRGKGTDSPLESP